MIITLIQYFKKAIYLIVLVGFSVSIAGSYEDFFDAIKRDDAAAVKRLLKQGFDPNTIDHKARHALHLALMEPSPLAAQALLDSPKTNLNHLNPEGESALMLAALKGQQPLAVKLIEKGADVNKTGWTPLHYAASNGHVLVIKLLLENHAYIDAESPNGSTPLMMAGMYGSVEAVKLLLEEGADPLLKNEQGLTALEFAKTGQRPDATEILEKVTRSKRATGAW